MTKGKNKNLNFYERSRYAGIRFKKEFKRQVVAGITAAFAFLIALSWRKPIQEFVDALIIDFGFVGSGLLLNFLSAVTVTLIAVLGLMLISRWAAD